MGTKNKIYYIKYIIYRVVLTNYNILLNLPFVSGFN